MSVCKGNRILSHIKGNWIIIGIIFVTFILAFLCLNDMQTAEGVGLYLTLLLGLPERTWMDWIVNVLGILCLFLLLFCPCVFLKRRNVGSFLRLMTAYLALMPTVSLAGLVHIFDAPGPLSLQEDFLQGNILKGFFDGIRNLMPVLRIGLPLLCLLLAEEKSVTGAKGVRYRIICPVLLLLSAGIILFPVLSPFLAHMLQYLLLLLCFEAWENLLLKYPQKQLVWSIIFFLFWSRGIYQIFNLMAVYHL